MTADIRVLTPRKPKRLVTPLDMTPEELNQPGSWKEETKTMTTPDWADEEVERIEMPHWRGGAAAAVYGLAKLVGAV